MATIFFVKDGLRPHTYSPGHKISLTKLKSLFPYIRVHFSIDPPEFNINDPSLSVMRVVVEIEEGQTDNNQFNKPGFYLLLDISPGDIDLYLIT